MPTRNDGGGGNPSGMARLPDGRMVPYDDVYRFYMGDQNLGIRRIGGYDSYLPPPAYTGTPGAPNPNVDPGAAAYQAQRAGMESAQAGMGIFGVGGVGRGIGTGGGASPMGGGASFGTQQMMGGASNVAAPMQRAYVPSWGAQKYKEVRPWSPLPTYRR